MSETTHMGLPYLEAAQAQKHVTVNAALARLDALVHLSVIDRTHASPPSSPVDGDRYIVAASATGAWAGATNRIAVWIDGAWALIAPAVGWRAWDASAGEFVYWSGASWTKEFAGVVATSPHGAATSFGMVEGDHTIAAGAYNDTSFQIPDRAIVLGVTGRVVTAITGATSWNLGVAADATRYGNGIGVGAGSTVIGPSGTPVTYWGATSLRLSAVGGVFVSGKVRLAVHYVTITGP